MAEAAKIEKFPPCELARLRCQLTRSQMDSWQAADMVSSFLAGRGYGVNANVMRSVVPSLALPGGSHEAMQSMLETIAFVM
jgi:hypothetical protein